MPGGIYPADDPLLTVAVNTLPAHLFGIHFERTKNCAKKCSLE
jgi:hypothetical protein